VQAAVVVLGGAGGAAGVAAAANWWGRRCWPVGPRGRWEFFYLEKLSLPRAKWPHDTRVPRASEMALGKEAFAGPAVTFSELLRSRTFSQRTWL
jgi:hypothetical protein